MNFNKIFSNVKVKFKSVSSNELLNKVDEYLFAFTYISYAYFNNDESKYDEIEKSLTYDRRSSYVDSIVFDDIFTEDLIVFHYFIYDESRTKIKPEEVAHIIEKIDIIIKNIEKQNFSEVNDKLHSAYQLAVNEAGSEQNKQIRIVTNFDADLSEKKTVEKEVKNRLRDKKLSNEWRILYSDDVIDFIDDVDNPTQTINEDYLIFDKDNNFIKHSNSKTSYIFNITGKSLNRLYNNHNYKLFGLNLRYYIKNNEVDSKLQSTLTENPESFWYFNNGIIIVAEKVTIDKNKVILNNFSIINGGQTTHAIGNSTVSDKVLLTCKVIVASVSDTAKQDFIYSISKATNSQKQIQPKDLVANRKEQLDLKKKLHDVEIFLEVKRGERKPFYAKNWESISNDKLAQNLLSFVYQKPGSARSQKKDLFLELKTKGYYETLFVNNTYDELFLKDLIYLQKHYSKVFISKKRIEKDSPILKDIKLNSQLMVLSLSGLFLKIHHGKIHRGNLTSHAFSNDIKGKFLSSYSNRNDDIDKIFVAAINAITASLNSANIESNKKLLTPTNFTKNDSNYKNIVVEKAFKYFENDTNLKATINRLFVGK
jgi:hypothetical protein